MHHRAHRQFDDLAALGARDVLHLHHLGRHVARRGVVADGLADAGDQRVVEGKALAQLDEQHHPHVGCITRRPLLADHQGFDHLLELFHLAVDLGGADAHAARVEGRVGAAIDDQPVVGGDLGVVAVAPDVVEAREIRRPVPGAVVVVPEADRHHREGRVHTSSPFSPRTGVPVSSNTSTAMPRPLHWISPATPAAWVAEHEARNDVGAARDRRQAEVGLDLAIDVLEALRHQRAAGGEHRPQRGEVVGRPDAGRLGDAVDELGRGAEVGHPFGLGVVEEIAPSPIIGEPS
jgi:hypothetical protein